MKRRTGFETVAYITQYDPPGRVVGACWLAELRDASPDPLLFPLAVAYVFDGGPALGPILEYIWVPDHYRRRGFATLLIRACDLRWPDLLLTDAIGPDGEHLMAKLVREGLLRDET